jgi:hypothetical protein
LGDLIADPTSARFFLLLIDWLASLLQLVFDGLVCSPPLARMASADSR